MRNNNEYRFSIIKEFIMILFACIVLVGCSYEIKSRPQANTINNPAKVYVENEPLSVQPESNTPKFDLRSIAYNDNHLYVAVGSKGRILKSTDGVKWIDRMSGTDKNFRSVIWGKKQFVIVGDDGTILTSIDGVNWEIVDSGTNSHFYKVRWDGKFYSAIGSGTILASTDGNVWTKKEVPVFELDNATEDKLPYEITDILHDGKQYIAVGGGNFILTSATLGNWVVRKPNSLGTGMFCNVEWNRKRYVAIGDHLSISTSTDGHNWSADGIRINDIESINDYYTLCLNSVVWGHDKFVAVGQKGLILESKDGLEWSVLSNYSRAGLNQVIWDGKLYISVGDNETIISSSDGIKWAVNGL